MKAFDGFKSELQNAKPKALPAGPYVAKILAVKIDGEDPDQALIIRVDVTEGPHANYFRDRFKREKETSRYEPRYKGDFRLRIPNRDNPKELFYDTDLKRFNDAMCRIEKSNPGYRWDWNEQGLVGKTVGINMQESEYNGVPFTRIGRLEIADDVRNGVCETMPPRAPRGDAYDTPPKHVDKQTGFTAVETDELPF